MTTAFLANSQDSVSTYEKLEGGHAKEIRYRPERRPSKIFFLQKPLKCSSMVSRIALIT